MADYTELVKKLRVLSTSPWIDGEPIRKAADVIEELDNKLNLWRHDKISRWIPVEERLPVVGDKVLVSIRDESGDARYDFTNTGWFSGHDGRWVVEDEFCSWVTHWMPLPQPKED